MWSTAKFDIYLALFPGAGNVVNSRHSKILKFTRLYSSHALCLYLILEALTGGSLQLSKKGLYASSLPFGNPVGCQIDPYLILIPAHVF